MPGCDGGKLTGPPFAYTVGLFGLGHPELLVIGAPMNMAYGVINDLGGRIRDGQDLVPGQLLTFKKWPHRIVVEARSQSRGDRARRKPLLPTSRRGVSAGLSAEL